MSRLTSCRAGVPAQSGRRQGIIAHQINVIRERFQSACDEAELAAMDRQLLWRRQLLNPFALYGVAEGLGVTD